MVEFTTTLLDVLGLILVAAGVVAMLLPLIGWGALAGGGVVVLAGSVWTARRALADDEPGGTTR